jgi:hypothetical protein
MKLKNQLIKDELEVIKDLRSQLKDRRQKSEKYLAKFKERSSGHKRDYIFSNNQSQEDEALLKIF